MARRGGEVSFQERLKGNCCFGCGYWNSNGLRIESYWTGDDEAECVYTPEAHQSAMPPDIMNGGIVAALIDCHSVCTAIADAYRREGRDVGAGEPLWYATGSLKVNYRKPTPINGPVTVRSRIVGVDGRKTRLEASVTSHEGVVTADGEVLAVRVPPSWADPEGVLKHLGEETEK